MKKWHILKFITTTLTLSFFLLISLAFTVSRCLAAQNWTKQGMVLDTGAPGQFDEMYLAEPALFFDGTTYKMWYAGYDSLNHWRIGYAISPDGLAWTKHGVVLDTGAPGEFDSTYASQPAVIVEGSTYKMWYAGLIGPDTWRIGYATSPDGLTWTKQGVVLDVGASGEFDGVHVSNPTVVRDGSTYKMWYQAYDGITQRIGYATSPNGITWTKHGIVLEHGISGEFDGTRVNSPLVLLDGTTYKMWYQGLDGVYGRTGYATSPDGLTWTKHGIALDVGAPGEFDATNAVISSVIMDGTTYKSWYHGKDGTTWRIGHATVLCELDYNGDQVININDFDEFQQDVLFLRNQYIKKQEAFDSWIKNCWLPEKCSE